MGQRHQIYVVRKLKDRETGRATYRALGAFHHQWCYGFRAALSAVRLQAAAFKAKQCTLNKERASKWEDYYFYDPREVDTLVKAIYGIDDDGHVSMVHNESEYLIEDDSVRPERGDNNDGAALIVIDETKQQVRVCMFTPGHVEGKYGSKAEPWVAYSPREYLAFYYSKSEAAERAADVATIEACTDLVSQREFNVIMAKSIKRGAE